MAPMPTPVETRIIRSAATGPEPCNTLAFLRCLVPGLDVPVGNDEHVRSTLHFMTEFRIDGYQQSQFEWYKANTLVSATASLKFISTTTDLSFRMAVDVVEPDLRQHDGTLAFKVGLGAWMQDDAWFGGYEELVMTVSLTAYVLCFEPRAERPKPGTQRTPWAALVGDTITVSDVVKRRAAYKLAKAAAQAATHRDQTRC